MNDLIRNFVHEPLVRLVFPRIHSGLCEAKLKSVKVFQWLLLNSVQLADHLLYYAVLNGELLVALCG